MYKNTNVKQNTYEEHKLGNMYYIQNTNKSYTINTIIKKSNKAQEI